MKMGMPAGALYPLYRPENIALLNRVILEDEFDDAAKAAFIGCIFSDDYLAFLRRNLVGERILDLGCGSGGSFALLPITHGLDASPRRVEAAQAFSNNNREAGKGVEVLAGASECLPYADAQFDTVLYLHGFFQVRSDYEALMEINRVLDFGGHFIFDFPHISRDNLEFGRVLEPRSYITSILKDFGFDLVERRTIGQWDEGICVEKVENFDYRRMKKIQLVPAGGSSFYVKNADTEDYRIR